MNQPQVDNTQISGFYGPGAWAAWVITMVISWAPIVQRDFTHNLHFIGYALYTNWATIDLMHHMKLALQHQRDSGELEYPQIGNLIASSAVLHIGIYLAISQLVTCLFQSQVLGFEDKSPMIRRQLFLTLGLVLPVSVVCFSVGSTFNYLVPRMIPLSFLFGFSVELYSFCDLAGLFIDFKYSAVVTIVHFTIFCFSIKCFILFFLSDVSYIMDESNLIPHKRCYFVPCAPQGIDEWDQVFSLLVALFLFLYEFGLGILNAVKKGFQTWLPAAW
jgi:hypothetical protein